MADLYCDVLPHGDFVSFPDSDSFYRVRMSRAAFTDSRGVISGADQENKENGRFTGIIFTFHAMNPLFLRVDR